MGLLVYALRLVALPLRACGARGCGLVTRPVTRYTHTHTFCCRMRFVRVGWVGFTVAFVDSVTVGLRIRLLRGWLRSRTHTRLVYGLVYPGYTLRLGWFPSSHAFTFYVTVPFTHGWFHGLYTHRLPAFCLHIYGYGLRTTHVTRFVAPRLLRTDFLTPRLRAHTHVYRLHTVLIHTFGFTYVYGLITVTHHARLRLHVPLVTLRLRVCYVAVLHVTVVYHVTFAVALFTISFVTFICLYPHVYRTFTVCYATLLFTLCGCVGSHCYFTFIWITRYITHLVAGSPFARLRGLHTVYIHTHVHVDFTVVTLRLPRSFARFRFTRFSRCLGLHTHAHTHRFAHCHGYGYALYTVLFYRLRTRVVRTFTHVAFTRLPVTFGLDYTPVTRCGYGLRLRGWLRLRLIPVGYVCGYADFTVVDLVYRWFWFCCAHVGLDTFGWVTLGYVCTFTFLRLRGLVTFYVVTRLRYVLFCAHGLLVVYAPTHTVCCLRCSRLRLRCCTLFDVPFTPLRIYSCHYPGSRLVGYAHGLPVAHVTRFAVHVTPGWTVVCAFAFPFILQLCLLFTLPFDSTAFAFAFGLVGYVCSWLPTFTLRLRFTRLLIRVCVYTIVYTFTLFTICVTILRLRLVTV